MKKVCLVLIACAATHEMVSHGGGGGGFGGGFATGALLGTGITLAATSGSRGGDRSPEYYEDRRDARTRSEIRQQIRQEERSITKLKGQIRKLEKDLERKNFSSEEKANKNSRILELQTEISDHKSMIKDLNEDLRSL